MKKPRWDDSAEDHSLLETTRNSTPAFQGILLDVRSDVAELPGGAESVREWIRHPGACAVVPVFEDGTILMIRQFRYPLKRVFLEVPAGKIDAGETIDVTARRELAEETGLRADHIVRCGEFNPCIGYSDEVIHVFCAWGLERLESTPDHDEFLVPVRVPFLEALDYSRSGGLRDAKTMCSLELAADWWRMNGPFPLV